MWYLILSGAKIQLMIIFLSIIEKMYIFIQMLMKFSLSMNWTLYFYIYSKDNLNQNQLYSLLKQCSYVYVKYIQEENMVNLIISKFSNQGLISVHELKKNYNQWEITLLQKLVTSTYLPYKYKWLSTVDKVIKQKVQKQKGHIIIL